MRNYRALSSRKYPDVGYNRKKYFGFTLLEVLVVFFIMGLILAIVPPFLPEVIAGTAVKSATRELAANLKHVRSQAIKRQQEMTLIVDVEQKNYVLDKKTKALTLPDDTALALITAKSERISETSGQIRFFPDGSSTGGQIRVAYSNTEYIIEVHWLTGRVKIAE